PPGQEPPDLAGQWSSREETLDALAGSRAWLEREHARQFFPAAGITHERALASVARLEELLQKSLDGSSFAGAVEREYDWFVSAGWDGRGGGVLYTGYFTPIFQGSLQQNAVFRYPLYRVPPDLVKKKDGEVLGMRAPSGGTLPYPDRAAIDGRGLLEGQGLELVWLADPFDAYLCHVQGSAFVELPDGELYKLGFGGTNGRDYTSLAEELVRAGELPDDHRGLPDLREWASENPEQVEEYLHKNERYVFFTPISGTPHGSLDFPVTAWHSLATDKRLFPRGAPVVVEASFPGGPQGEASSKRLLAFDQDTGGGIRTAGRADLYVGIGDRAGDVAGRTRSEGQLY
ncbi:MAG TPA: MltA domain-containing protein, partial [Planctomycetota bacterium]|nr:MltA domain-containing protein [Planctomycetota bacterium]